MIPQMFLFKGLDRVVVLLYLSFAFRMRFIETMALVIPHMNSRRWSSRRDGAAATANRGLGNPGSTTGEVAGPRRRAPRS